jgi:hypothetical protein
MELTLAEVTLQRYPHLQCVCHVGAKHMQLLTLQLAILAKCCCVDRTTHHSPASGTCHALLSTVRYLQSIQILHYLQ